MPATAGGICCERRRGGGKEPDNLENKPTQVRLAGSFFDKLALKLHRRRIKMKALPFQYSEPLIQRNKKQETRNKHQVIFV